MKNRVKIGIKDVNNEFLYAGDIVRIIKNKDNSLIDGIEYIIYYDYRICSFRLFPYYNEYSLIDYHKNSISLGDTKKINTEVYSYNKVGEL